MTTQNCAECGTRAEPGQSFCDACGAVLSWTDRTPARAAAAPGSGGAAAAAGSAGSPEPGAGTGAGTAASAGTGAAAGAAAGSSARRSEDGAHEPPAPAPDAQAPDDHHDPDDEDTTETPLPAVPPESGTATPTTSSPAAGDPPQPGAAPRTPPAPAAPSAPAPDTTAPTAPVPSAATAAPGQHDPAPAQPDPAPALGDTMAARARSLLVPVADAEPRPAAPPSVAPVLPGRPVADRPQVRAPGPVQGEMHGVACPWCATPNNPDRHFCVRCAMPMTLEDRSSQRLPWWRRLFHRGGVTPWAGDRPRLRRTFDRIVTWVVAAVVLTLLIIAGVNTPAAVQATRDHFSKRAPVPPDSVAASRSYPGHKPELAFDKINNSWWGPGVSQSGEGEWIEARFDEPTRLLDVIITSGTSVRPDQLSESALPHRIKATITLKDGKTTTRDLVLDQSAGGQRRAFRVGEVTKVRFTIESSYSVSASKQVSIAEIEFFGRSSAGSS